MCVWTDNLKRPLPLFKLTLAHIGTTRIVVILELLSTTIPKALRHTHRSIQIRVTECVWLLYTVMHSTHIVYIHRTACLCLYMCVFECLKWMHRLWIDWEVNGTSLGCFWWVSCFSFESSTIGFCHCAWVCVCSCMSGFSLLQVRFEFLLCMWIIKL